MPIEYIQVQNCRIMGVYIIDTIKIIFKVIAPTYILPPAKSSRGFTFLPTLGIIGRDSFFKASLGNKMFQVGFQILALVFKQLFFFFNSNNFT